MYFPTLKPVDFPAKLHQFPQQLLKIHSFEMEQLFGALPEASLNPASIGKESG